MAGLSLGWALAHRDIPVTVYEKSHYPRHKVCGEFITGLATATREKLNLNPIFEGALEHRSSAWYFRDKRLFTRELPQPGVGISRWLLDQRLSDAAKSEGVELIEGVGVQRFTQWEAEEGWIDTAGVSRGTLAKGNETGWLGLKVHCRGFEMIADLELHLGHRAYAGMSKVEDGRTNVCMLLNASACAPADRRTIESALEAVGLSHLRRRLMSADVIDASRTATAGIAMSRSRHSGQALVLGDGAGMIPPFTGHGMAMAFESAAIALEPLIGYSRNALSWCEARAEIESLQATARSRKLRWAGLLHPFLLHPFLQRASAAGSRLPVFPWKLLYNLTH